jgi:hypothetical protein
MGSRDRIAVESRNSMIAQWPTGVSADSGMELPDATSGMMAIRS